MKPVLGNFLFRARPCTAVELFKFGWTLYIHIKSEFPYLPPSLPSSLFLLLSSSLSPSSFFRHKYISIFSYYSLLSFSFFTDQYPLISDDLVNSHYLLLCCVNMLYTAAILNKRTDLVSTAFPDLPEWFAPPGYSPSVDFSSMLPVLCKRFNGNTR